VFVLAALSITVLTGYAGQISFGQYALVGVGSLLGDYLVSVDHLNFWAGLIAIPLVGAAIATLIGIPALQIRGIFLGITTLGFAVAASDYFFNLSWFAEPDEVTAPTVFGVNLGTSSLNFYYFALIVTAVVFMAVGRLRKSALGRNMAASRDNSQVATAYGISVLRTRLLTFALSGTIAALAGYIYLYAIQLPNVTTFTPSMSLSLFAAVVVAGVSTRMGAVIAGLYVQGLQSFVSNVGVQYLTTSLGLLLVLIFIPQGLSGLLMDIRDVLLRTYASRRGIELTGGGSPASPPDAIPADPTAAARPNGVPGALAPTSGAPS
jgi:branched-chain amino acid transport system permease protein